MRKVFVTLGVALGGLIVAAGFSAVMSFPATEVSADYSTGYLMRSALIQFFDLLPTAVVAALVLSFSLLLHPFDLRRKVPLAVAVQPVLVATLMVGAIVVIWHGSLGARVATRMAQIRYTSRVVAQVLTDARTNIELERPEEARVLLEFYVSLTGKRDEVADLFALVREIEAGELFEHGGPPLLRSGDLPPRAVGPRSNESLDLTPPQLIDLAAQFLAARQYYSAHYHASMAIALSAVERPDARRIQAMAWEALNDGGWQISGADERALYRDKLQAYQALQQGAAMPERLIESYYLFQSLNERVPSDPDVARYYPIAAARVREIAFFIEEAHRYRGYPGLTDLAFVNRRTSRLTEVVSADQFVQVDIGDYLYGVEIMGIGTDGAVLYHLRAPYAKRVGSRLVLRAVPREGRYDPQQLATGGPQYFVGSREPAVTALFDLDVDLTSLVFFASSTQWLAEANLARLTAAPAAFATLGLDVGPAHAELVDRFLRIFGYFVAILAAIGLAWRFRGAYLKTPPFLFVVGVVVLPLATRYLLETVRYLARLAILTAFSQGGSRFGLAALSVVIVFSLAGALGSVLQQRT